MAVVDTDKTVRVIKLETNQELASRKWSGIVDALAFQPDPAELWIVESDVVRSWNYGTTKVRECAKASGSNHEFSPDGKNLLYCGGGYKAFTPMVTDTTSWKSKEIGYTGNVRHLSLSPDATKLAIAADNTLVVWNLVENCAVLKWKKPHYSDIRHAAFSADGQRIACVMNGGQAYLFDFRCGAKDSEIERPKPKAGERQCLEMVGPDDQMDREGGHLAPLNPLPVACSVCKRLDLDFVQSPYMVGKKIESPVDFAPAVAGNFLIRESMKQVLGVVAPGLCKFHPTIHHRTRQPTPWLLAVPQFTQTTSKPSGTKCRKCGEPREWNDIVEVTQNPISKHEVFKAHNWWRENERNLYFSVRLETLVKKLGLRGMVRSYDCRQEPTAEDLAWVNEKLKLLAKAAGSSADEAKEVNTWFKKYLQKKAKTRTTVYDFAAVEKKHGLCCRNLTNSSSPTSVQKPSTTLMARRDLARLFFRQKSWCLRIAVRKAQTKKKRSKVSCSPSPITAMLFTLIRGVASPITRCASTITKWVALNPTRRISWNALNGLPVSKPNLVLDLCLQGSGRQCARSVEEGRVNQLFFGAKPALSLHPAAKTAVR